MKTFKQLKLEKIKEDIKRESKSQKEYKIYISENKQELRAGVSSNERREILKHNNYHRGSIVEGKERLTYLHQEYNMLKNKDNSHFKKNYFNITNRIDKIECKRYIVHLDYDSFEFCESTDITNDGYLINRKKINARDILFISESKEEAKEYFNSLNRKVENTNEMKALRIILEKIREEQNSYNERKKKLESDIAKLQKSFDEAEQEPQIRRRELSNGRGLMMNEMFKIKQEMLKEAQNEY